MMVLQKDLAHYKFYWTYFFRRTIMAKFVCGNTINIAISAK